jgi:enoyl-CoA hydratase/carnithine racemase
MDSLIVEKKAAVGHITFNDPAKLNAMSYDMWVGLTEALAGFEGDDEVKAVLLTGAGDKAFVSGANIAEFQKRRTGADAVAEYERAAEGAQDALYHFPKPTIARIRGYCIGGGLNLALCCDVRIACEGSTFFLPAGKMGLGYRFSAIRNLVTAVGAPNALDIFLSARRFDAAEALQKGLIQLTATVDQFEQVVQDYVEKVSSNAPLTLRAGKHMIRQFQQLPPQTDLEQMRALMQACFDSEDYAEGKQAFADKRPPQFRGR